MNKKELGLFKEKLISMRHDIHLAMKMIKQNENESTSKEASGDLSSYSFHLADQGTDSMDHQRNFIFAEIDSAVLYDIDTALEKLDDGSFGLCELCGQEIPHARLEVIPFARLCVKCQSREEEHNKKNHESHWNQTFPLQEEDMSD